MFVSLTALLALQAEYLPVHEGARQVYIVEELGAEAAEPAREVTTEAGFVDKDGWIELRAFLGYSQGWMRAVNGSIEFRIEADGAASALTILKTSAQSGDTWKSSLGREDLSFTFRGEEPLELGDERVRALHVEFSSADPLHQKGHSATRGDLWFVAGRGLVRAELTKDLDCHSHTTRSFRTKLERRK